ncbi:ABC transporter permease [Paenibacillus sp. NEAU-GSW1]|uniref:ABC transporter permease n=1 Tax=Paenibacillus sp. NEAU-GSW1 TaxID=2682486 RepID=UPI0015674B53|nr:ABC transporter permease [Paenibacillus sp. NEAU-GSW1]
MIEIIQSEWYRIRKSRLLYVSLSISAFFMFALVLTYHHDSVRTPSLDGFTQFLFSDYSLIYPLVLFLSVYFTDDYKQQLHTVLFAKGVRRSSFFGGKLLAAWIISLLYVTINVILAFAMILTAWAKIPNLEYTIGSILGFLSLQILCFIAYASFIWLTSCLLRSRILVLCVNYSLLVILYLYLTRMSEALDLSYSLYRYWIVGLSTDMRIAAVAEQSLPFLLTIAAYLILTIGISWAIYRRTDFKKRERR